MYLGTFRIEPLRLAGGWDDRMHANQDFDLNRRMARTGKVWFDSDLQVELIPRATIAGLFKRHRRFGRYKVRYWRLRGEAPRPRQWVLILGPPIALGGGDGVGVPTQHFAAAYDARLPRGGDNSHRGSRRL